MPQRADLNLQIKAAFRDLVKLAGGQERSALVLGISQARISEACSVNHPERSPRVDHVAVLEADADQPVVTKLLAQLAGQVRVALDPSDPLDPHLHLARIIKETGDVTSAMSQALADGRISPAEARGLRAEADAAILVLQEFTAQLTTLLSEGSGQ